MVLPLTRTTAADAYGQLRIVGQQIADRCNQLLTQLRTGSVESQFLLDVLNTSTYTIDTVSSLMATPGLPTYIQAQLGDATVDLTASITAALANLMALRDAIVAEYPKDANGFLLDRQINATSQVQAITISPTALPNTSSAVQAFLSSLIS